MKRTLLVTVIVVASGSGVASAVTPGGPCFPSNSNGGLESFTADDQLATFCISLADNAGGDKMTEKCMSVDLGTGVYTDAKPIAKSREAIEYKQDRKAVQACSAGKCVKLEVPKLPKKNGEDPQQTYTIHASADGKKLLATGNWMKNIVLLDGTTGKKTGTIPLGDGGRSECLEEAYYLGDVIYAITSVCAGPGGTGHLLTTDGKKLAKIDQVNVYGATPLHLDGDRWAFSDFGGGNFTIWDVKAAKEVRTFKLDGLDCADCTMLNGDGAATPLVKTPSGKLVTITNFGVTVADPRKGTFDKTRLMPMCPAPKSP